jgi:hypothetical protein
MICLRTAYRSRQRKKGLMEYIIVTLVTFAIYLKSIFHNYVVDDDNVVRGNKGWVCIKDFQSFVRAIYGAGLFQNPIHDHLFRIFLTACIGCMIFACWNNLWVALLWVVHPINNQLTLWLNGRRYQVSLLLGLICYKIPMLGFVLFPLALYIHPIVAPMIIITAFMVTPIALLWVLPSVLCFNKLKSWLRGRFTLQNFELYKKFNWGKPVLALKCFSEYLRHGLFPTNFTMYHPEIWGVAELPGNKVRAYALNASFWLCLAFVLLIGYIGWYIGGTCLVGLLIAFIGVVQWLGIIINPTQLWAQRYTALSSIGFCMFTFGVCSYIGGDNVNYILLSVLIWYSIVTLKDMEMYRDLLSFFWYHYLQQPHNMHAAYFGSVGLSGYAAKAKDKKNQIEHAVYSTHSQASAFFWCYRNKKADLMHGITTQILRDKCKRRDI